MFFEIYLIFTFKCAIIFRKVLNLFIKMDLHAILKQVVEHKASDAHFKTGHVPTVRLANGSLFQPIKLTENDVSELVKKICNQKKLDELERENEVDVSYDIEGLSRFRINVYTDYKGLSLAIRVVPHEIPNIVTLGLPEHVKKFTELQEGLILVTGPTGHGKSTTLAALLDQINQTRACHIVTIEDPIEFLHESKKSIVSQREVGIHTGSFVNAIKSSLREDPDVIMVGEMRDRETVAAAMTLAETGHLVFSTVHTIDAVQTIDRIIDVFSSDQQSQIKAQLAGVLKGIASQRLIPSKDNKSRVLVCEVMIANDGVRNCILESKINQIYSLMQLGRQDGMQTFEDALQILKKEGRIK